MGFRTGKRQRGEDVPDVTQAEIAKDYEAGVLRVHEIAAKHGVSPSYPSILARRMGLIRGGLKKVGTADPRPKRQPAPDAEPSIATGGFSATEVRRLRAKGVMPTAIAALLRCPYRQVVEALDAR